MIKEILTYWVPWVIIVILVGFTKSLLRSEVVDWDSIITMSITGLIAFLAITGIKWAIEKAKDKTNGY